MNLWILSMLVFEMLYALVPTHNTAPTDFTKGVMLIFRQAVKAELMKKLINFAY